MRSIVAFGSLAFALGMAAQAQEPVQMTVQKAATGSNETKTTAQVMHVTSRCPVAMRVRQGSSAQMLRADDGTTQPLMTPSLTLTPSDHRAVVAANVTIHGLAPHGRTLPLNAEPSKRTKLESELTRTLELTMKPNDAGEATAEMMLTGFGIVKTVELNSVTYDDGSRWRVAKDSACSVEPDPLLLIAGH